MAAGQTTVLPKHLNTPDPDSPVTVTPIPTDVSIPSSDLAASAVISDRAGLSASAMLTDYVDAASGFRIRYPSNWFLDVPKSINNTAQLPADYSVSIMNFDPLVMVKRETLAPDELKVTIYVSLRPADFTSLDDWMAKRVAQWHPDTKFEPAEPFVIDGAPALRRTLRGGLVPEGAVEIVTAKGNFIYAIIASPAESTQSGPLESVLHTMKLR
jgi:hypothetical protein